MSTTVETKSGRDMVNQVDHNLEAVVIPVTDVDRSKAFYASLGWRLDADFGFDNGFRVVRIHSARLGRIGPVRRGGHTTPHPVRSSSTATRCAEGRIEKTLARSLRLAAEPADIGHDSYSPVTDDYDPWDNAFTGTINKVTVKHKEHQPA